MTTYDNGVANFNLVCLKESATWIRDRVCATTLIRGAEITSSITFTLPAEKTEAENGDMPTSVYPIDLTVTATAGATTSYILPVWASPYGVTTYTTSSSYSAIVTATRVYTFTAPAGVTAGTVYHDFVTASDGGTTGATAWVRIVAR